MKHGIIRVSRYSVFDGILRNNFESTGTKSPQKKVAENISRENGMQPKMGAAGRAAAGKNPAFPLFFFFYFVPCTMGYKLTTECGREQYTFLLAPLFYSHFLLSVTQLLFKFFSSAVILLDGYRLVVKSYNQSTFPTILFSPLLFSIVIIFRRRWIRLAALLVAIIYIHDPAVLLLFFWYSSDICI